MHELLAIPIFVCVWMPQPMADPDIALALFFLGIIGIYAEFSVPGMVAPGVIGSILALLALAELSTFSIDWRGAALIVLAFAFFVLEAKYVTQGLLTAMGGVAMLLGMVTLIVPPQHRVHFTTALAITLPFATISSFLFSLAVRARRNKVVVGIERSIS